MTKFATDMNQIARNMTAMDGKFVEATQAAVQQSIVIPEFVQGMSRELFNYASHRLAAHADHLQMLGGCQTFQAVMEQQMGFMRSTADDFARGFKVMMQAGSADAARRGTTPQQAQ